MVSRQAPCQQTSGRLLPSRTLSGFTLIELLVVMAILGIVMAITLNALNGSRSRAAAEAYIQTFATDMKRTRTNAMSTGTPYRVTLTSAKTYTIERLNSDKVSWATIATPSTTNASLTSTAVKTFTFDTRGFMVATDASGIVTTNTNLTATMYAGNTRTVIVTALGLARAF